MNKKAYALGILMILAHSTTQPSYSDYIPAFVKNISADTLLNKKALIIGSVIAGSAVLGYWLYDRFFVFTLDKTEKLCKQVPEHIYYINNTYKNEITLIESTKDIEHQKKELKDIICQNEGSYPFMTYTNKIQAAVDECQKYEAAFCKAIPQLEKSKDKLKDSIKNFNSTEKHNRILMEINHYKDVLTLIAELRESMRPYHHKLEKLISYCKQFEEYNSELLRYRPLYTL